MGITVFIVRIKTTFLFIIAYIFGKSHSKNKKTQNYFDIPTLKLTGKKEREKVFSFFGKKHLTNDDGRGILFKVMG